MKKICLYVIIFAKKQILECYLEWFFILPLIFFLGSLSVIVCGYVDWDTRRGSVEKEIQVIRTNSEKEIKQKKDSAEREFKAKQAGYAKELSYLASTLSETIKKYESSKNSLAEIETQIKSREEKLKEIEFLRKQVEDLSKEKNTLDEFVSNLLKQKTVLSADLENATKRETETKALLADLSAQVINLSGELNRSNMLKNENDKLLIEIESNKKKKSDLVKEISDKRISVDTIAAIELNKAELLKIKKAINEEATRLNSLKVALKEQEKEKNELNVEIASLAEKLAGTRREFQSLSEKMYTGNTQLNILNKEIIKKTNELDSVGEKLEVDKNLAVKLDKKRTEYNELVKQIGGYAINLNDLSNRIYDETKKLNALIKEKEQISLEIRVKTNDLHRLNAEIKARDIK